MHGQKNIKLGYLEGVRTDGRILKLTLRRMGVDSNRVAEDREWLPSHAHTVTYSAVELACVR